MKRVAKKRIRCIGRFFGIAVLATLGACKSTPPTTPTIPTEPMCTILISVKSSATPAWNGQVFVSDRTEPAGNFTAFRPMSGPRGAPLAAVLSATGVPDTFAVNEVWQRGIGSQRVHRAQAVPGPVGGESFYGIAIQDERGNWRGSNPQRVTVKPDIVDPETAVRHVPRFMLVGIATQQVFACAPGVTQDGRAYTTSLIESVASTTPGIPSLINHVQDVLYGDDFFVPNAQGGPLVGPAAKPIPPVSGPGDISKNAHVRCAMTQNGDDIKSRELHMFAIANGVLYHSKADDFGPASTGPNSKIERFRGVSSWADVGAALGGGFGDISEVAVVGLPSAISVFFVSTAKINGSETRSRLIHTARFNASNAWRPVKDILALNGDAPTGAEHPFKLAAGICPQFGAAVSLDPWKDTETLVVLTGFRSQFGFIRVVQDAQFWKAGVQGSYSPVSKISDDALGIGRFGSRDLVINARPFRDDASL